MWSLRSTRGNAAYAIRRVLQDHVRQVALQPQAIRVLLAHLRAEPVADRIRVLRRAESEAGAELQVAHAHEDESLPKGLR